MLLLLELFFRSILPPFYSFSRIENICQNKLRTNPRNRNTIWFLANFYLWHGRYQESADHLESLRQIGKDSRNIRLLLARAYFKLAQYAKVEQLLVNHGILTDKDKENYYLGDSLIELGRFGEGAEYLKRYVKYHPRDYIAFVRLGYAYFKEELYDLALEAYRQAEILNPQKIEIKDSINLCYEKLKQMKPGE